jgi:hypothetical protein
MDPAGDRFDSTKRLGWAQEALRAAGKAAAAAGGQVPPDLAEKDGWRWRVLDDLTKLSAAVQTDYKNAKGNEQQHAWEAHVGTRAAIGGGAAVGSVISAIGAGVIKTNATVGWILVVFGVLFAVAGAVFSADAYIRSRNQKLRFLRLLHDIWDFAYLVLPSADPIDAFDRLSTIRTEWETAGG